MAPKAKTTDPFDEDYVPPANGEVARTDRTVTLQIGDKVAEIGMEELRQLDFASLVDQMGYVSAPEAVGTDQYGPILEDKAQLVGRTFMAVHWEFHRGNFGQFVTMYVLTKEGDRFLVNDGSSGILQQLRDLTDDTGQTAMLLCEHGLRVSTYDYELPNGGVVKDAQTFYIDTRL